METIKKDYSVGIFTFAKKHNRPIERCGSSMIRGKWMWDNWENAEEYVEGKKYDVVVFQKVWHKELYENLDCIKILDLCDPEWINKKPSSAWPIMEIAEMVDAIVVSSKGLEEGLRAIGVDKLCEIKWIDDRIDLDYFPFQKRKISTNKEAKIVGWYGYHGNGSSSLPVLIPYLKIHNLKLHCISDAPMHFPMMEDYVENFEHSWSTIPFELMKCDFIVNPPIMSPSAKYKSKNKTYLAWAFGLPVVHNSEEFSRFLNGEERTKESKRVYNLVREEHSIEKSVKEYDELIQKLWKKNTQKK